MCDCNSQAVDAPCMEEDSPSQNADCLVDVTHHKWYVQLCLCTWLHYDSVYTRHCITT